MNKANKITDKGIDFRIKAVSIEEQSQEEVVNYLKSNYLGYQMELIDNETLYNI